MVGIGIIGSLYIKMGFVFYFNFEGDKSIIGVLCYGGDG